MDGGAAMRSSSSDAARKARNCSERCRLLELPTELRDNIWSQALYQPAGLTVYISKGPRMPTPEKLALDKDLQADIPRGTHNILPNEPLYIQDLFQ